MNGIFNSGLSFWQFIIGIITITASLVTIKLAINFDINKYLERKDQRLSKKLRNTCTHIQMEFVRKDENNIPEYMIQSLFESPSGTTQWQCQKCGLIRNHNNDYKKQYEY